MKKKFVGMEKQINQLFVQVSANAVVVVVLSLLLWILRIYYFVLNGAMQEGVPLDMDYIE